MKTMKDLSMVPENAVAVVRITVEIATEAWGPDCTLDQVVRQSIDSATQTLRTELKNNTNIRILEAEAVRVVCNAKRER